MSVPVRRLGAGYPVVSVRSDTQPQRMPRPVPVVDSPRSLPPPPIATTFCRHHCKHASRQIIPARNRQRNNGPRGGTTRHHEPPAPGPDSRAHPFGSGRFRRYIVRIDCRPFHRFGDMYSCCRRIGTGVKTDRDFADGDVPSPVRDACHAKRKTSVALILLGRPAAPRGQHDRPVARGPSKPARTPRRWAIAYPNVSRRWMDTRHCKMPRPGHMRDTFPAPNTHTTESGDKPSRGWLMRAPDFIRCRAYFPIALF